MPKYEIDCMATAIHPIAPRPWDSEWWDQQYYYEWVGDPDALECMEAMAETYAPLPRIVDVPMGRKFRVPWKYVEYTARDYTDFILIDRVHDGAQALLITGTPEADELRSEPPAEWGEAIDTYVEVHRLRVIA